MSRIIKDHRVHGRDVLIFAANAEEAKIKAVKGKINYHAWDVIEIEPGMMYAVYIAEHDAVFALDD